MDATGKITMNGAQINGGEINQINNMSLSQSAWLKIKDGAMRGGTTYIPTGETEPVSVESGYIQFFDPLVAYGIGGPLIFTNNRLYLYADTIFTSKPDNSAYGIGRTGSYVTDLTYRTLKDLLDTYLLITKDSDGRVTDVSWLNGNQVNIAIAAVKRQLVNGIATDNTIT